MAEVQFPGGMFAGRREEGSGEEKESSELTPAGQGKGRGCG